MEPDLERRLEALARKTGQTKSFHAYEAIREYVEDREDHLLGIAVWGRQELTISLEELERRLQRG
ncbi:MAG TPA: hypothetical protein VGW33_03000 [Terriglobia bacterium]|nr:hypothetical protein [Terriglobia bacterium]